MPDQSPRMDALEWGAARHAFLGLGLLSTALAHVVYFRVLTGAEATNLLLETFLLPISAILLGGLLLGETLSPGAIGGMIRIGLGLAALDGRPWLALRRRPRLC